jgi:putative oxidoreductase
VSRLMSWSGHAWLGLAARWYLAYVFIYACLHKIIAPGSFALDVATYDILPLDLINVMAIALPWIELVAGLMLIAGLRARAAGLMVAGMMAMFLVAIVIAMQQGLDMSCGCFASQAAQEVDPISWRTVLRDSAWLGLAVYVAVFDRAALGVDRLLIKRRENHA